jgi:hypothetical protein
MKPHKNYWKNPVPKAPPSPARLAELARARDLFAQIVTATDWERAGIRGPNEIHIGGREIMAAFPIIDHGRGGGQLYQQAIEYFTLVGADEVPPTDLGSATTALWHCCLRAVGHELLEWLAGPDGFVFPSHSNVDRARAARRAGIELDAWPVPADVKRMCE